MNKQRMRHVIIIIILFCSKIGAQTTDLRIADSLYSLENYTKAIKSYQKITPKNQHILLRMAQSHKAKGTYRDALKYYKKAIQLNTDLISAKLEYGKLLMSTKKFKKADSVYSEMVLKYKDNPNFQYRLGLAKKKLKDTTAITYFQEAFRLDSTHQKSCFEVAKYYLKKRKYTKVKQIASQGLASYQENPELINVLAQNYLLRKYYSEAIPYFEKLITLNHGNEYVHTSLALCYHKNYDYKLAITQYQEALKYNDQDALRYTRMAKLYTHLEMHTEALANNTKALVLKNPPVEKEFLNVAMSLRHLKRWKEAIKYAKLALKENPEFVRAQYQLAVFADAYYDDPKIKLEYYQLFLKKFEDHEASMSYFNFVVKERIEKLEKEIFEKKTN